MGGVVGYILGGSSPQHHPSPMQTPHVTMAHAQTSFLEGYCRCKTGQEEDESHVLGDGRQWLVEIKLFQVAIAKEARAGAGMIGAPGETRQ